jgi:hypothetical protein
VDHERSLALEDKPMSFRRILQDLVTQATLRGAILCDEEGERIDAAIRDPALGQYELDLLGASYAIVLHLLKDARADTMLRIVHEGSVVCIQGIVEGYYLVVLADRDGRDPRVRLPLGAAARALRAHL